MKLETFKKTALLNRLLWVCLLGFITSNATAQLEDQYDWKAYGDRVGQEYIERGMLCAEAWTGAADLPYEQILGTVGRPVVLNSNSTYKLTYETYADAAPGHNQMRIFAKVQKGAADNYYDFEAGRNPVMLNDGQFESHEMIFDTDGSTNNVAINFWLGSNRAHDGMNASRTLCINNVKLEEIECDPSITLTPTTLELIEGTSCLLEGVEVRGSEGVSRIKVTYTYRNPDNSIGETITDKPWNDGVFYLPTEPDPYPSVVMKIEAFSNICGTDRSVVRYYNLERANTGALPEQSCPTVSADEAINNYNKELL